MDFISSSRVWARGLLPLVDIRKFMICKVKTSHSQYQKERYILPCKNNYLFYLRFEAFTVVDIYQMTRRHIAENSSHYELSYVYIRLLCPKILVSWCPATSLSRQSFSATNSEGNTDYTDWGFTLFSLVPSGIRYNSTINEAMNVSCHILSNSLFTVVQPFDATDFEILTEPINKLHPE
jgi:hypothetical protein